MHQAQQIMLNINISKISDTLSIEKAVRKLPPSSGQKKLSNQLIYILHFK